MGKDSIMCPSSQGKAGALLLGVRQNDGKVAILPEPLPVDEQFIAIARQQEIPARQRFRFTNKCCESGCGQWTGKGCGVVESVIQYADRLPEITGELPACGIRSRCRWFMQREADACRICPYILYEVPEEVILDMQQV